MVYLDSVESMLDLNICVLLGHKRTVVMHEGNTMSGVALVEEQ